MKLKRFLRKYLPGLIALLFISSVGIGLTVMIPMYMSDVPNTGSARTVHTVKIIQPVPPPPRIERPPLEPEPEDDTVDLLEPDDPELLPDIPGDELPAGDTLGLDAEGAGAGDSFGLVGRKGGRGLLAGIESLNTYPHRFAGEVEKHIQDALYADVEFRRYEYTVLLRVWIAVDGSIEKAQLVDSTGHSTLDAKIEDAIKAIPRLSVAPPPDLPMPMKLRIKTRL